MIQYISNWSALALVAFSRQKYILTSLPAVSLPNIMAFKSTVEADEK